jgi:hypothetical protein
MKKYVFVFLCLVAFSCSLEEKREKNRAWIEEMNKPKPKQEEEQPKPKPEPEEGCKPIQNKNLNVKKAFFGADTKIVIATYTEDYASKVAHEDKNRGAPSFNQEIILTEPQKEKFFDLLYGRKGSDEPKKCYEPYHLVRFYKNEKEVASIEICFGCSLSRSYGINTSPCDASVSDIASFFNEVGLKPKY